MPARHYFLPKKNSVLQAMKGLFRYGLTMKCQTLSCAKDT